MSTKRPCAVCGVWFEVKARNGKRHRVCGKAECQATRNKRSCAKWRQSHPDEVQASRIRRKLLRDPADPPEVVLLDPMRHFNGEVVRKVVGVGSQVVLEEFGKVLVHVTRHVVPPKGKVRRV